jgi:ribonuclease HI
MSAKYLGIVVDQHLNWKAQHVHAIEKGSKWTAQIRRIARPTWGITPKYAHCLYISVALPRILYGANIWCGPPKGVDSNAKNNGSAKVIRQLTTIQRSGTIAITGALRTSPTDVLDSCVFLLPAVLTVEKWCHRTAARLATTPPGHPLHKPANASKGRYIKCHRSPLHNLLTHTDFDPKRMEKIPTKPRNPAQIGNLLFTIRIPDSKEASIAEDYNATEVIKIYTDGSAHKGKVSAAAVLIRAGEPTQTLHYHLGSESEHTIPEAELIGLLLALHLIKAERKKNKSFAIGTDNHAALKAFHSSMRSPAHYIAREVLKLSTMLCKHTRGKKYSLMLQWTAGHVGILGNELADREAKQAAVGLSSHKSTLPKLLRCPLTINPSAVHRKWNTEIKQHWKNNWRNSKRGKTLTKIDPKSPSPHFLHAISNTNISCRSASHITQLYIGHVSLNDYLKRFKRADSARCPACGAGHESVRHFLMECPIYVHKRWILAERLSRRTKVLTLEMLLGEEEAAIPLSNFITASLRFTSHP